MHRTIFNMFLLFYLLAYLISQQISPSLGDLTYYPADLGCRPSNYFQINTEDGSKILITVGTIQSVQWLDVSIFIPSSYTDTVGGLCNSFSSQQGQLLSKSGSIFSASSSTDIMTWAESWRIPNELNLFIGGQGASTMTNSGNSNTPITSTSSSSSTPPSLCRSLKTIVAGDTCYNIWTTSNLSQDQFLSQNPGISCDKLQIGQKVCVDQIPISSYQNTASTNNSSSCTSSKTIVAGDTCFQIWTAARISENTFKSLNPKLNCDNLVIGQSVCVSTDASYSSYSSFPPPTSQNQSVQSFSASFCPSNHFITVSKGDTCSKFWTSIPGLSESLFLQLNPDINCNDLKINQQVCIGQVANHAAVNPSYYQGYDTINPNHRYGPLHSSRVSQVQNQYQHQNQVASIAAQVPPELQIPARRRRDAVSSSSSPVTCKMYHTIQVGESCYSIWTAFGLSVNQFTALNPDIACSQLRVYDHVCVGGTFTLATSNFTGPITTPFSGPVTVCSSAFSLSLSLSLSPLFY